MNYKALKHIRKLRNLSQRDVCAEFELRSGRAISDSTLSGWENGRRRIFADDLLVLADIYGVSLDVLCGRVDIDRHSDLTPSFLALPESEQELRRFLFENWHGDIHSFMHSVGLYASLRPDVRGEILLFILTRYNDEKAAGRLCADLPVDVALLSRGLEKIMKEG